MRKVLVLSLMAAVISMLFGCSKPDEEKQKDEATQSRDPLMKFEHKPRPVPKEGRI